MCLFIVELLKYQVNTVSQQPGVNNYKYNLTKPIQR